jgi:hypothetical protein
VRARGAGIGEARSAVDLLVIIGADRPRGGTGYDGFLTHTRSALSIEPRAASAGRAFPTALIRAVGANGQV